MTLKRLPWNDAYGFFPTQPNPLCPDEIIHLRTGARMRLVPRGTFQMGLSAEGWDSFRDAVLRKTSSPPITSSPSMSNALREAVLQKWQQHGPCVIVVPDPEEGESLVIPSVNALVEYFIRNPEITKPHVVFTDAFYIDVLPASRWMFNLFLQDLAQAGGHDPRWCHPDEQFCGGGSNTYFLYLEEGLQNRWWKSHPRPQRKASRAAPAMGLDWFDAWAFTRWRDARLPTEAEWEKASRGLTGQLFPWGNELLDAEIPLRVHPKSGRWQYKDDLNYESPYGCRHMVTGPWEWCDDWFLTDAYDKLPTTNPNAGDLPIEAIPPRNEWGERCRVLRGGLDLEGFYYPCANRFGHMPQYAHSDFGVRCALSVPREVNCDC